MDRRLFPAVALLVLLVLPGCTTAPKEAPAPVDPSGPLIGANQAVNAAEQYLDSVYSGSVIIVPFTLTRKMQGGPCAWDGDGAGNATKWMMVFEGVIAYGGFGKYLVLAVTVEMRDGKVGVRHDTVQSKAVDKSGADNIYGEIDNVSLASGIDFDSHAMFLRAAAAKWNASSMYYLQSIAMTLYDNSTSPRHPGPPSWEASWKYIAKDTHDPALSVVVLDATSGEVLEVVQPQ